MSKNVQINEVFFNNVCKYKQIFYIYFKLKIIQVNLLPLYETVFNEYCKFLMCICICFNISLTYDNLLSDGYVKHDCIKC